MWPKPNLLVTKSGDVDCSTPSINLIASGDQSYRWMPLIGLNNTNFPNPIASPVEPTEYQFEITYQNKCTYTEKLKVNVLNTGGLSFYKLPSAFTPKGDGLDDCFGIAKWGSGIILERFLVFDLWGAVVFSGNKEKFCWNETIKGQPAQSGTFVYPIRSTSTLWQD